MAPPVLNVDPNIYYDAAKKLLTLTNDIHTAVGRDLAPKLATTASMGGNYPAVAAWNSVYHGHAGDVREATMNYAAALQHFADILNIAGYNWEDAEYNANISQSKGTPPQRPTLTAPNPLTFPEIPDPNGDNGPGLTITSEGQAPSSWTGAPNGRADTLEAAAATWDAFAAGPELTTAPRTLTAVHDSFNGVRAAEVADIQEALDALRGGATQIADVAKVLATQLRSHHDNLLNARTQLCAAAPGAFPSHEGAQVNATSDNTSIQVSIAADLSAVDVDNAENIFSRDADNTALFSVLNSTDGARHDFVDANALSTLPKLKALTKLPLLDASGNQNANTALRGELDNMATWQTPASTLTAADLSALDQYGPQMKEWAMLSVKYGNEAGVDPRMVLAMALQEGAPLRTGYEKHLWDALKNPSTYHPNPNGADDGRKWDRTRLHLSILGLSKTDEGNSIGLTNLKERPFNDVKKTYPDQFRGQQWSDLVGNDDLALKATAYNLKMLNDGAASHATAAVQASQPLDQFLGSGYNALGVVGRSQPVAEGFVNFKPNEVEHGQSTVSVVNLANQILCGSGAYR